MAEMTPIDRAYVTLYSPSIATMAVSAAILEILAWNCYYLTTERKIFWSKFFLFFWLEIVLRGTRDCVTA